jgi:hypothetical protein
MSALKTTHAFDATISLLMICNIFRNEKSGAKSDTTFLINRSFFLNFDMIVLAEDVQESETEGRWEGRRQRGENRRFRKLPALEI